MSRIKLALVIGGGVLCFFGIQEYRVGSGTSSEPVAASLKDLEEGKSLPNNFIKIGKHLAAHHETVYYYQQDESSNAQPGPGTPIEYSYHPIVSLTHPFVKERDDYIRKIQDAGGRIPGVPEPKIKRFSVLVKTKKYKTLSDIPDAAPAESVQGLVINSIDSLDSDEKKLLQQSFPNMDLDKVFILEQGREPASGLKMWGMILGGLVLSFSGIAMFIAGRSKTAV